MDNKYRSRKFLLACTALYTGVIALFMNVLEGGEFITLCGVVLALYGGANVMEKRQ